MFRAMIFGRLSISAGLVLGLSACGGDDPDSSTETSGTTSATAASTSGVDDATAVEGTSGGDPSADDTAGDTTSDDAGDTAGATTDSGEESTSAGADPETSYFRFTSLNIRDPHFFAIALEVTDVINDSINEGLTTDDPERPDGMLDLGFVLSFTPLDQGDAAGGEFSLANAQCLAPVADTSCALLLGTEAYPTTFASQSEGECYAPTAENLSEYDDPPAAPTPTTGPCFVSAPTDVSIIAGAVELPLSNAVVAAQYVGDPADNLVEGNLQGFISAADAASTTVSTPLGEFELDSFLDDDDADGDGWVFHIAFTAEAVDWAER